VSRCCLCNTLLDLPQAQTNGGRLLEQILSPDLNLTPSDDHSSNSCATAARALDVTTVISRAISQVPPPLPPPPPRADLDICVDHHSKDSSTVDFIASALCYSCRLISREIDEKAFFRGRNQSTSRNHSTQNEYKAIQSTSHMTKTNHNSEKIDCLPSFLVQDAMKWEDGNPMKEQINDYLLHDSCLES